MPKIPFVVSGIIREITGQVLENAAVQITVLRTGEAIGVQTNAAGEYIIDLANMTEDIANNDEVVISAYKKAEDIVQFQQIRRRLDTEAGFTHQDMSLVAQNPAQPEGISPTDAHYREHDPVAQAKRMILVGYTEAGEILPLKVTKDSSGHYGLLNVSP